METFIHDFANILSLGVEALALALIASGIALATIRSAYQFLRQRPAMGVYNNARRGIGRTLILGLDFLVAAEIIRSIHVGESTHSVLALGIVVVIRTFLAVTIEMEIDGRWPWQAKNPPAKQALDDE